MTDTASVSMVATRKHLGYYYDGVATERLVLEGERFTTTFARSERLIAKGVARVDSTEPAPIQVVEPVVAQPELEPAKVDKRTKAFKASHKK